MRGRSVMDLKSNHAPDGGARCKLPCPFNARRIVRRAMGWKIPLCILAALCGSCGLSAAQSPQRTGSALLIEKENIVDARLKGSPWKTAAVGTELNIADQLRTGEFSRAAMRFTDLSVLRI